MAEFYSIEDLQRLRHEREMLERWMKFYSELSHAELLEALVHEQENDFPLRRSGHPIDLTRHQALIKTLDMRAQTEFLRSFLTELRLSHGDLRMN